MIRSTIMAFGLILAAATSHADDVATAHEEMKAMVGGVPSFVEGVADAALPGMWETLKGLTFSPDTALDPKTKALVSLAVSAQIPCEYCIFMDTGMARQAGATDQEIAEAVAIAAQTRAWSTIFHGTQVDLEQFKTEMGGS
jgi:AhpD family alkylhydroperoxidase